MSPHATRFMLAAWTGPRFAPRPVRICIVHVVVAWEQICLSRMVSDGAACASPLCRGWLFEEIEAKSFGYLRKKTETSKGCVFLRR